MAAVWTPRCEKGYKNRGSRMLERRYECMFYLLGKIPSIETPGRTVLDETFQANVDNPFHSRIHLMDTPGQKAFADGPLDVRRRMARRCSSCPDPRGAVGRTDLRRVVRPRVLQVRFWYYWAYIFALAPQHSVIECRRYLARFAMYVGKPMIELTMIIHTQYNEYDSVIRPIET